MNYWIEPSGFAGVTGTSLSYRFPNTEPFEQMFPNSNRFRDRLSNWQSGSVFTNPAFDRLHRTRAQAMLITGSVPQLSQIRDGDTFVIYRVRQMDTIPHIAAYYRSAIKCNNER